MSSSSSDNEFYEKNPYSEPLTLDRLKKQSELRRRSSQENDKFEGGLSKKKRRSDEQKQQDDEHVDVVSIDSEAKKLKKKQQDFDENEEGETKRRGRKPKAKKEDHYSRYQPDQIKLFISLVEENPPIYDPQNLNYCRREIKNKLFDSIEEQCSHFMPRGRKYGAVAEARWNEVVADYKAHLRRNQNASSGSGVEDIRSRFEFEHEMNFFNNAIEKRAVKNAFVISGSKEDRFEHHKKPFESFASERKTKSKDNLLEKLVDQFAQSTKAIQQVVSGNIESQECKSTRICEIFQEHTAHWSKVNKFKAEAQVINFIESLHPGMPSASHQRLDHVHNRSDFAMPLHDAQNYQFREEYGHGYRPTVYSSAHSQRNTYEDPANITLSGSHQGINENESYRYEFEDE